MLRYMIRKEYFGAYVYDYAMQMYLLFDKDSYDTFVKLRDNFSILSTIDGDIVQILRNEEFIKDDAVNYYIIDNGDYDNVMSAPMRMHFLYTNRCNLNCIHCFSSELSGAKELCFEDKVKILDEMNKIGMCEILIGGGEPFVRSDIFDFINECNKRNIIVKISTNGLLFNDSNFEKILNADIAYIAVSVDGTNNEEYALTRGVDGLSIVKNNILKLKKAGCKYPILISTTINNYNQYNPIGFLEFTEECYADRLKIRATKPNGNILKDSSVMINPNDYLTFLGTIQKKYNEKYAEKFQMDLTWGDFRLYYDYESGTLNVLDADLPYTDYGCVAGKTAMCIGADGIGTPCGFLPDDMQGGTEENVIEKSILDVWHNGKSFILTRSLTGNKTCRECDLYDTCRGGCVARNSYYNHDVNGVDPWCIKQFFPLKIG